MKKQILKAFTMLVTIMAMALVTAVVSANAQTSGQNLRADVPFDFVVGDKTMTAGEFSVRSITQQSDAGIAVRSADSSQSAIRLSESVQAAKAPQQSMLVFHRYGDKYYLAQIWTAGKSEGRELLKSKSERALERETAASQNLASNAKPEIVTVIASLQ